MVRSWVLVAVDTLLCLPALTSGVIRPQSSGQLAEHATLQDELVIARFRGVRMTQEPAKRGAPLRQ